MQLIYSNDRRGAYPDSWYAATTTPLQPFAPLKGSATADVCVVGAGYTGLSTALHLAQAGRDVVLIDAQRVGFGASGRNGGQLGTGQRVDQKGLETLVGRDDAQHLWGMGLDAVALCLDLIKEHSVDAHVKQGVAWSGSSQADVDDLHRYADHMDTRYAYSLERFDAQGFAQICPSPDYRGGILDMGSYHLHPLAFALGLARACVAAGVRIFEGTHAQSIEHSAPATVHTDAGRITASHVVLAGNGYLEDLDRKVASRVMPINNFIAATAPLGDEAVRVLARDVAVADSRFVVNYFRLSHDRRLLFGGGESYGYRFPKDIAAKVRGPMTQVFPHLKDIPIDYAWGGTLAITMKRLPFLYRAAPNVLSAGGYSGHGLGNAVQAGQLMAQAIEGQTDGFDAMAAIPSTPFPGGGAMRTPLLALAMSWYALRDRLGI
ncbi:FAD-binding oxidoreductase [Ascidiaceihabitans sp.]|uniref:NAD(P)/FAD-dependent oxidoreductase n=1 Tax=Ascidiaceihabitans sp. TaxID=1872644 RepID=UPI003299F539